MMGDPLFMYIGPYQDVVIYISVSNTWFGVGVSHSTVFCSSLGWYGSFRLFCSGNLVFVGLFFFKIIKNVHKISYQTGKRLFANYVGI